MKLLSVVLVINFFFYKKKKLVNAHQFFIHLKNIICNFLLYNVKRIEQVGNIKDAILQNVFMHLMMSQLVPLFCVNDVLLVMI